MVNLKNTEDENEVYMDADGKAAVEAFMEQHDGIDWTGYEIVLTKKGKFALRKASSRSYGYDELIFDFTGQRLLSGSGREFTMVKYCVHNPGAANSEQSSRMLSPDAVAHIEALAKAISENPAYAPYMESYSVSTWTPYSAAISFTPKDGRLFKLPDIVFAGTKKNRPAIPETVSKNMRRKLEELVVTDHAFDVAAKAVAAFHRGKLKDEYPEFKNFPSSREFPSFSSAVPENDFNRIADSYRTGKLAGEAFRKKARQSGKNLVGAGFKFALESETVEYEQDAKAILDRCHDVFCHRSDVKEILSAAKPLQQRFGNGGMSCTAMDGCVTVACKGAYEDYSVEVPFGCQDPASALAKFESGIDAREKLLSSVFKGEKDKSAIAAKLKAASNPDSGDIVMHAAAAVVAANSDFITENRVVKLLRGLKTSQYTEIVKTEHDGKYNLIPDDDIHEKIDTLKRAGVVREKEVKGDYGRYYILKPSKEMDAWLWAYGEPQAVKKLTGADGQEKRESVYAERYAKRVVKKHAEADLEYLMGHPAVWCSKEDDCRRWLSEMPDELKQYLAMCVKYEDDRRKKKYLKLLDGAANPKAPKKNAKAVAEDGAGDEAAAIQPKKAAKAKAAKPKAYSIVRSDRYSSRFEVRYVVMDADGKKVLDDANGYGYKSKQNAERAWRYKNRSPKQKAKEAAIAKWLREHKSVAKDFDTEAFYNLKDTCGNEGLTLDLAKRVLEWNDISVEDLPCTLNELVKGWARS